MEDNDLSIDQLKSVYKAQTEAYLDFNLALINLLSNQKELLSKVEGLQILSDAEFKSLSREYYALEKLFVNFQNSQVLRDDSLEGTTDDFKATITNFNEDINSLKIEVKKLTSMHWEIKNSWNKLAWTVGGILAFLTGMQVLTGKGLIDIFK